MTIDSTLIQVSQESLPDSTERCVEVSGTGESCLQCAYHICGILQDSQIRGHHVPYVPKGPGGVMGPPVPPAMDDRYKPVFLCGDKAFVIEGNFAVPAPPGRRSNNIFKYLPQDARNYKDNTNYLSNFVAYDARLLGTLDIGYIAKLVIWSIMQWTSGPN